MKRAYFICLFLCLTTSLLSQSNPVSLINQTERVASPISASQPDPQAQAMILDGYGELPLSFEANHGQADARVKFLSRTGGYTLFLTGDEAVLAWSGKKAKKTSLQGLKPVSLTGVNGTAEAMPFPKTVSEKSSTKTALAADRATGGVLRMKLRNANRAAKVTGVDQLAGTSNYFIGNDPAKWRTNVTTYAKVKYEEIYSGIDLVYYGNQRQLEYDFIVAPGADPHRIAFDVRGAKRIRRDVHGDLVLKTTEGEIRWHKPVAYQEKNGTRQEIAAQYGITDMNRVGFELAKYDATKPLYIDPLIYSTYLGGGRNDGGYGIAVDSTGNAYVTFMKGKTVVGTGSLSGGSASFTTSTLPAATNYIKAVYGGDANIVGSTSKPLSQVVSKATTTTTLTSLLNPSSFGQSVTFTASVTSELSGTVNGPVTFYDGTTALKTVYLSAGMAKCKTATLASGTHSITATYNGNPSFIGSSASLTQTVD